MPSKTTTPTGKAPAKKAPAKKVATVQQVQVQAVRMEGVMDDQSNARDARDFNESIAWRSAPDQITVLPPCGERLVLNILQLQAVLNTVLTHDVQAQGDMLEEMLDR